MWTATLLQHASTATTSTLVKNQDGVMVASVALAPSVYIEYITPNLSYTTNFTGAKTASSFLVVGSIFCHVRDLINADPSKIPTH